MKLALLSDIHGNLPALEAVLHEIDLLGVDAAICLGDVVGYGPQPRECVDLMMERGIQTIMGNHDACVAGQLNERFFTEPNRSLLRWTRGVLSPEHLAWLSGLPMSLHGQLHVQHKDTRADESQNTRIYSYVASHASPLDPEKWEWLDSAIRCREILEEVPHDFVFVGHTHVPALIANELGVFGLERGYRFMVNPGSIGQSRDHDRRASFSVLDLGSFTHANYRVDYDISRVRYHFHELGYDDFTIKRLINI